MNILKGMDVIILSFTAAGTELNRRLCEKIRELSDLRRLPGGAADMRRKNMRGEGSLLFGRQKDTDRRQLGTGSVYLYRSGGNCRALYCSVGEG